MRSKRYGSNLLVEVVIVIAIIVLVNLLSLRFFARADFTEGNLFSISKSTKQVLRNLDDVVNVKIYFSKDLPPYLTTLTREIRDILGEYTAYAGGNLIIDFEDPAEDPETEQRVQSLGIPPVQLNIIEQDKAEVMNAYLGIAILFEDRKEVIPVVQSAGNLEYDLTSAILKVASGEQKTVGFLAGHGEPDLDEAFEAVRRTLEQQYIVKRVETASGQPVPLDVNTLVIAGPRQLGDWDLFAIDQFLMRGGRLMFMVDRFDIPAGSLQAVQADTGLDSLLASYGITVRPDMVLDRSSGTATFSAGFFRYTLPYPFWPMVVKSGFNAESPVTNQLERAVFPWTSSVAVDSAAAGGLEIVELAKSSVQSWTEEHRFDLNPQRPFAPTADVGPRTLAVLLSGSFPSYFAGRGVPQVEGAELWQGNQPDRSPETQVLVVGNSKFAQSDFLGQYPENHTFFMNAIDWLTLGDSLIGIRSRVVTSRPLKQIGEKSKATIRLATTFGIPIVLIVWGLIRRYIRSSRRREWW
jgi:gliding-associated putative ABC transporter substrate-binding component GldG